MHLLDDFRFLPDGRILAGAGTAQPVTLFNCFVGVRPGSGRTDGSVVGSTERRWVRRIGGVAGGDQEGEPEPVLCARPSKCCENQRAA
jgi:hypothetical protein